MCASVIAAYSRRRLLVLAEGRVRRGQEEEKKLCLEFQLTLNHLEKCVASLAAGEKALIDRIKALEIKLVRVHGHDHTLFSKIVGSVGELVS